MAMPNIHVSQAAHAGSTQRGPGCFMSLGSGGSLSHGGVLEDELVACFVWYSNGKSIMANLKCCVQLLNTIVYNKIGGRPDCPRYCPGFQRRNAPSSREPCWHRWRLGAAQRRRRGLRGACNALGCVLFLHALALHVGIMFRHHLPYFNGRSHQLARKSKPCLAICVIHSISGHASAAFAAETPSHTQNDADKRDGQAWKAAFHSLGPAEGPPDPRPGRPTTITLKFASGQAESGARQRTKNWPFAPQNAHPHPLFSSDAHRGGYSLAHIVPGRPRAAGVGFTAPGRWLLRVPGC